MTGDGSVHDRGRFKCHELGLSAKRMHERFSIWNADKDGRPIGNVGGRHRELAARELALCHGPFDG